jgi:hypothetical protein
LATTGKHGAGTLSVEFFEGLKHGQNILARHSGADSAADRKNNSFAT